MEIAAFNEVGVLLASLGRQGGKKAATAAGRILVPKLKSSYGNGREELKWTTKQTKLVGRLFADAMTGTPGARLAARQELRSRFEVAADAAARYVTFQGGTEDPRGLIGNTVRVFVATFIRGK
jgi:hypothetical protein